MVNGCSLLEVTGMFDRKDTFSFKNYPVIIAFTSIVAPRPFCNPAMSFIPALLFLANYQ